MHACGDSFCVSVSIFPRVTRESEFSHASCAMNQNFASAQQKNRNTSSSHEKHSHCSHTTNNEQRAFAFSTTARQEYEAVVRGGRRYR
jgi:hypothetical protein